MLTFVLERCGFRLTTATNLREALAKVAQASFDLVPLAYRRPQMIVSKLAHEIKQLGPGIPLVLIAGCAPLSEGELTNVDDYASSGASLDDLLVNCEH
jgi:CheY-like chemotaxis protein